jgi:hypothetical protein
MGTLFINLQKDNSRISTEMKACLDHFLGVFCLWALVLGVSRLLCDIEGDLVLGVEAASLV